MGRTLDSILFWLGIPIMVLLVLTLGAALALQCWLEHRLHGYDYDACMCEEDPLGCGDWG